MKVIYLKSALKSDSFDVSIGIKNPFSRVSVTIEPNRSLLTVRYHELFETDSQRKRVIIDASTRLVSRGQVTEPEPEPCCHKKYKSDRL